MKVWYGEIRDGAVIRDFIFDLENRDPLEFDLIDFAMENGIFRNTEHYYETLRKMAIQHEEKRMRELLKKEDMYIMALVRTFDETVRCINLLMEKKTEMESLGYEDEEIQAIQGLKERILSLQRLKEELEDEIREKMESVAPNLTRIAGHMVGARLIEKAGGLKKLSALPASKIQVLGAERALYRALSKGKRGKPPKHGIIYQHPMVRTLKKNVRGKMARFMAGKISIAVKLDFFSGRIDETLEESVRKRYEELRGETK